MKKVGLFYIATDFNHAGPDHTPVPCGDRTVYIRAEQVEIPDEALHIDNDEGGHDLSPDEVAMEKADLRDGESFMNAHELDS